MQILCLRVSCVSHTSFDVSCSEQRDELGYVAVSAARIQPVALWVRGPTLLLPPVALWVRGPTLSLPPVASESLVSHRILCVHGSPVPPLTVVICSVTTHLLPLSSSPNS